MYFYTFLLVVSLLIPMIVIRFERQLTIEILRDLRVLRIFHYVALTGLGVVLYTKKNIVNIKIEVVYKCLLFVIALTYAAVFAIISNNFEDLETDKISNRNRPLVKKSINENLYWKAGVFCQIIALLISFFIQKEAFFCISFISLGYYIYSCKPFRFKKIPFFAKLIIGLNSLSVAIAGFQLVGGEAKDFPIIWVLYILIPLTLSANFVDLKDIEGDKIMNVRTLPVIWGEQKSKLFIAVMTVFSYLIPGFILNIWWLFPISFLMLSLHLWFLYKKPYNEKPIFLIYVTSIFGLNFFLVLSEYLQ